MVLSVDGNVNKNQFALCMYLCMYIYLSGTYMLLTHICYNFKILWNIWSAFKFDVEAY